MKRAQLVIITLIFFIAGTLAAQTVITTDSVSSYMGKQATVKGFVSQVTITKGGMVYINLDGKYPFTKLTGVIFKEDISKFGNVKQYELHDIELTGTIEEYKEKPQIVLKNPEQLKIAD